MRLVRHPVDAGTGARPGGASVQRRTDAKEGIRYAIQVDGLTKRFGGRAAVDGVTFSVQCGEVFGLLGPNGAGKTTVMRVISTLTRPDGGRASVLGHDVVREPRDVRRHVGLVFQEPSLDHRMTAYENLHLHGLLYGLKRRELRPRIEEALQFAGLEERAHSLVRTFSGGMRRRLELVRAFLHRPPVLILDEPTIGLDPQSRRAIWDYVFQLRTRDGVTVFLTTHYMDEAERCDRVAIIDNGRLVALGAPYELKSLVRQEKAMPVTLEDVFVHLTGRSFRDAGADAPLPFARLKGR